jgi:hypothetical protein
MSVWVRSTGLTECRLVVLTPDEGPVAIESLAMSDAARRHKKYRDHRTYLIRIGIREDSFSDWLPTPLDGGHDTEKKSSGPTSSRP